MIRVLSGLEVNTRDVCQVSSPRFLVNWTLIHPGISPTGRIDGVDVDNRHCSEEHFCRRFNEFATLPVPSGPVQVEPVYIDTFSRRLSDVVFEELGDVIVEDDAVKGPAFVRTRHFL